MKEARSNIFGMSRINLFEKLISEMSPTEFEEFCLDFVSKQLNGAKDISIEHDKKVDAHDGTYQIDGLIEFTIGCIRCKTILECKQYKNPVPREKIEILFNRLCSIGANKGILISTAGFQSGAIKYASEHGIALIQILDRCIKFIQMSGEKPDTSRQAAIREKYLNTPKYLPFSMGDFVEIEPDSKFLLTFISKDLAQD